MRRSEARPKASSALAAHASHCRCMCARQPVARPGTHHFTPQASWERTGAGEGGPLRPLPRPWVATLQTWHVAPSRARLPPTLPPHAARLASPSLAHIEALHRLVFTQPRWTSRQTKRCSFRTSITTLRSTVRELSGLTDAQAAGADPSELCGGAFPVGRDPEP